MAHEEDRKKLVDIYKKATLGEAVDPADQGEYDNEGAMAKTALRGIIKDASHMIEMFDDEQNLPEWVQAKIIKSADYLNTAHRYMMNKDDVNEETMNEAIDMSKAGQYARVMNPKTREIRKVLKTDVRKYVQKGWTHMTQLKNRLTKKEEVKEATMYLVKMRDGTKHKRTMDSAAAEKLKKDPKVLSVSVIGNVAENLDESVSYALNHKTANKILSTYKTLDAAKQAWKDMDKDMRVHYQVVTMKESLRSDIAKLSAKFPEGSKVKTKHGEIGKVLTVGKDFVKVAIGNKVMDYKPSGLQSVKNESKGFEEETYISEKLKVSDGIAAWVKDFQDSDAPQFKGKNDKERRDMAIAAYLSAKREAKKK